MPSSHPSAPPPFPSPLSIVPLIPSLGSASRIFIYFPSRIASPANFPPVGRLQTVPSPLPTTLQCPPIIVHLSNVFLHLFVLCDIARLTCTPCLDLAMSRFHVSVTESASASLACRPSSQLPLDPSTFLHFAQEEAARATSNVLCFLLHCSTIRFPTRPKRATPPPPGNKSPLPALFLAYELKQV